MPPTAALQASISGGANVTGGISAVDSDTCQLTGVSTVGWAMQRYEIYSFPTGFALPAGWSLDAVTGAYYYAASAVPPIFTMTPWGKYLFRLTIGVSSLGLGLDSNGAADPSLVDNTCAVSILSPAGLADLAWNETTQFSPSKKWVHDQAANLRILNTGLGGGTVPNTRTITAGAGLTGGGNFIADRTIDVAANADGSIVVNADDIQVGVLATDAQHGVRGGGTQHAAVTGGANGFMIAADKTKLDGVGAGATVASIGAGTCTTVGGTASVPTVNVTAASAGNDGSMSMAHYSLVAGATKTATPSTLVARGAAGESAFSNVDAETLAVGAGGAGSATFSCPISMVAKIDTYAATVTISPMAGGHHETTLTGNVTFAVPTIDYTANPTLDVYVIQGGTGSYTVTWASAGSGGFAFPAGMSSALAAATVGWVDYFQFKHRSNPTSHWVCSIHNSYTPP